MKSTSSATARKRKPAAKAATPAPAATPDEPLAFDDEGIKRVQDIIRNARATWFALLGALVFASVTLASVKDVSFFVNTVETKLPVVGISVPVVSFFWAGALLTAALYAYFHLYLELLWQALGDFPARDKSGALLADRIEPWIVADTALRYRDWLRRPKIRPDFIGPHRPFPTASRLRSMPWISGFVSLGLVWVFGLAVIFWFWWRSMPAHEPLLTLFLGAVLWVTVFVFGSGLAGAWTHLKFENHEAQGPVYWQWSVPLVFVAIVGATLVRTGKEPVFYEYESEENPLLFGENVCDWQRAKEQKAAPEPQEKAEPQAFSESAETSAEEPFSTLPCWRRSDLFSRMLSPAPANLRKVVLTEKTKGWQSKAIAEIEFRVRWCKERGEPKCPNPLVLAKRAFPDKVEEEHFKLAWEERWTALLAQMPKPDLRDADLRRADFGFAQMDGAILPNAQLQGADLSGANLEGADLIGARLEDADLSWAQMENANLSSARLDGADLSVAYMKGANLNVAWLQSADLSDARLWGANLVSARLNGANLRSAQIYGADLSGAEMEGADLSGAEMVGARLEDARLDGADLSGARLFGDQEKPLDLTLASLSAANLQASAFRFARVSAENLRQVRNFGSSFGDTSVELPSGFARPCQWAATALTDVEYFGRWEGWLASIGESTFGLDSDNYPPIPPPAGCPIPPAAP